MLFASSRVATGRVPKGTRHIVASTALAVGLSCVVMSADQGAGLEGRPVVEVLRMLQSRGLQIIFSSELVPPALRVKAEPQASEPKAIALEILAPHGLTLVVGPNGTLIVTRAPRRSRSRDQDKSAAPATPPSGKVDQPPQTRNEPMHVEEHVPVTERLSAPGGLSTPTYSLDPPTVRDTAGTLDNVLQVMRILPGVAATNDQDGKFAVRGGGPEHNVVVLDGVRIHNPYRFGELTSSFINPATASRVSLDASGFDARYGGRLSSATFVETRDGSAERPFALSGSLGMASGDLLLEGRVPGTTSGSWWTTVRGTYYRLFKEAIGRENFPAFADVQFKVSLKPAESMRLSAFGLVGRESMRYTDDTDAGTELTSAQYRGDNRIGIVNFSWTPNPRIVATGTFSRYAHDARDYDAFVFFGEAHGNPFERSVSVHEWMARQGVAFALGRGHVIDTGVELSGVRSRWRMAGTKPPIFWRGVGPSTWGELITYPPEGAIDSRLSRRQVGAWLQHRMPVGPFTLEPAMRVDWNSFTRETAWQPRARLTYRIAPRASI